MTKRKSNPHKTGRPTKFDPRMIEEAFRLTRQGATDAEMAEFWKVALRTFMGWKKTKPDFLHAINEGKAAQDDYVEQSLLHRAKGYSHPAVKIFNDRETGVTEVNYIERYPPDPTSMIFWLKNRRPDRWRDKSEVEVIGDLAAALDRAHQRKKP